MTVRITAFALALMLAGCARSSTIPLAQDTIQVTTTAAPICGAQGAQKVAFRQAAIETLQRGYDNFIVIGGQAGQSVVGQTPVVVQPMGRYGAIAYGGTPMVAHDQGLTVKMFRAGDPAGANALSARDTLGPKWEEALQSKTLTCTD